jgi:hypothetical protein
MRRIGMLMSLAADDPEGSRRLTASVQGLQKLGWTDSRDAPRDSGKARRDAAQLIYADYVGCRRMIYVGRLAKALDVDSAELLKMRGGKQVR